MTPTNELDNNHKKAKKDSRKLALAARSAMSTEERQLESLRICQKLEAILDELLASRSRAASASSGSEELPVLDASLNVAVYSAMGDELDLTEFIKAAHNKPGVRVCFPCMEAWENQRMSMRAPSPEDYHAGNISFIKEPLLDFEFECPELKDHPFVHPEDIDMIIVPLVAFDNDGNRLGYGGGNYDRFIPRLKKNTCIVGVAFESQRLEKLPIEPHDVQIRIIS
ncbi:MAG: 5-formyltetrahydrofolate cyclo-ligase [Coriobacteriales bacterium]|nr:5-formyltetrahydrofolate cyclo-ligase [Coriobacteriales bacterium]